MFEPEATGQSIVNIFQHHLFHWDFPDFSLLLKVTGPSEKLHLSLTHEALLHMRSH